MTIKQAIKQATIILKTEKIISPNLKSRLIMQYVLNKPRKYLIIYDQEELKKEDEKKYFEYIEKLKNNLPLEYITHKKEFMKLNFFVDDNILIPRQDTECLVEEIIKISKEVNVKKILDLCTGSGAIGVSLAKYIKKSEITASDISEKALKIARKNAENNDVENQMNFIKSDLFEKICDKYDIIVSNPPYIKTDVIETLDKEVQKEPHIALDGGKDGLKFYKKIIKQSYEYLKYDGFLCLEIGYDQKDEIINLIENEGKYTQIYSKKDLYGNDRIVVAKLK